MLKQLTPPYYAVIFTSLRLEGDEGYRAMANAMEALAAHQKGYLGIETARDAATGLGITVSYWRDEASIRAWRENSEHVVARRLGREKWYSDFQVRVCRVEREYGAAGGENG